MNCRSTEGRLRVRSTPLAGASLLVLAMLVIGHPSLSWSAESTFKGFWKVACTDAFGAQIKPAQNGLWSVSFCGPGGCDAPGQWAPNTTLIGDPNYEVVDDHTLIIKGQRYTKCTDETNPKLDYSSMKDAPAPKVVYLDASEGLPDYEAHPPFVRHDPATTRAMHAIVVSAKPTSKGCASGSIKVGPDWKIALHSNICDQATLKQLISLVGQLAPTLHQQQLAFWVLASEEGRERVLLVTHMDLTPDPNAPYPFLNMWRLKFTDDDYSARHAGAFLNGSIHAIRTFGEFEGRPVVFVKHLSCLECEPTVYLTPLDFEADGDAKPYEFTYDKGHESFAATFEFELPGMGHTVDAKTETRTLPASTSGPHLLQHFHMLEPGVPDEWWAFSCKRYRCDYKLDTKKPSPEFKRLWDQARPL